MKYTLAQAHEFRQEIKRSRFIALAQPVDSAEQAMAFFTSQSDFSARHNCWAYRVGNKYRFNDDGEPGGTAGKPILSAIDYAKVCNVAVLVIRWFGGIKLGTGGLARAYGGSASSCLNQAELIEIREMASCFLQLPFELSGAFYQLINIAQVQKISEEFSERGLILKLQVESSFMGEFELLVQNASGGSVQCQKL